MCIREEDNLPSNHAPVVFHTNPCNFASFETAIKTFAFRLKSLELFIIPNILPLFLSPIVVYEQLCFVVINDRKGFWSAKVPHILYKAFEFFAIFKSSFFSCLISIFHDIGLKIGVLAILTCSFQF